jgi:hypothetical protein
MSTSTDAARVAARLASTERRRRRVAYSLVAIAIVLAMGTVGINALNGSDWVDSFYFECMLATGQGPPFSLTSDAAKLFASFMAFVSIGTVLTSLVVNLGPVIGRLWREGIEDAEREMRRLEHDVSREYHEHEQP